MVKVTSNKLSKVLSMLLVLSIVLSSMAFTLPVGATDPEPVVGTVLWEQDFDDVNIETLATDHADWKGTLAYLDPTNPDSVLRQYTYRDTLITWADAEDTQTSKISFADGKLTLTESTSTYHGGAMAQFQMDIIPSETKDSGYTVLEFDYSSDAMGVKNRHNEYSYTDVMLQGASDGRTYGKMSFSSTNGVQDLFDKGVLDDATGYTNIVAGSEKNNIMSTENYNGETIHVAYIYDLANFRYKVSATRNGQKAFGSSEWIQFTPENIGHADGPKAAWFVRRVLLTMAEAPGVAERESSTASYDNFKYTHYTALPQLDTVSIEDGATDVATAGTINVKFNEQLDAASIGGIKLAPTAGGSAVAVTPAMNGTAGVDIAYTGLAAETSYTLTVPTTVTSNNGLPISAEKVVTFTTASAAGGTDPDPVDPDPVDPDPTEPVGTLLWSENFDGLTAGRNGWTASVGNYASSALTTNKVDGTTVTWDMAANSYTSKLAFTDGKLLLGQKRNTEHGSEYARLVIPMNYVVAHPTTGYTIFEYDYYSDALPIRNRFNERSGFDDLIFEQQSGSGRVYAKLDITSTNGIQDMLGTSSLGTVDAYNSIVAGSHKNNIRTAADISGKVVHMAIIYDIDNLKYNICAKVDGEYSYRSSEWMDIASPVAAAKGQWFDKITITQNECNVQSSDFTTVTYDNMQYTAYTELPAWAVAPTPTAPVVESTTPANGATSVNVNTDIAVKFDQIMDVTTLDNIKLHKGTADGAEVALTKTVAEGDKSVTFAHDALDYEATYVLVIPTTVKAKNGLSATEDVNITFTTAAYDPVIWSENFDTLPTGVTANTSVSSWYTDGWNSYVQANGYTEGMNEFKFVDGKLQMTKGQNAATKNKGLIATKTITGAPTSGVVQLEYDYTANSTYAGDAYVPSMAVINTDGKQLCALNFGSAYFGVWVNKIYGPGSVLNTIESGGGNEDNSRVFARGGSNEKYLALVDGGVIHVTTTINLDSGTYSITLTKDGVDYHTPTALFDIDPDITNYQIGSIGLVANCATTVANETDTPVVSTYDNLVLRTVEAEIPTIVSAQAENGATGVGIVNDQKLTFSTPMDIKSLANITLVPTAGGDAVALTPVLSPDGKTATFTHAPLAYNTQYTMTVPTTVKSSTAGALETAATYTYTTIAAPAALKEGTIWSENFDTLTSFTEYSGSWIKIDGTPYSSSAVWADYHNKVELKNGKLVLTKAQEYAKDTDDIQLNIPFTGIGTLATTGKVSFEFDYKQNIAWDYKYQCGFRVRNLNGKDISNFGFCSGSYGIMDKLYGGTAEATKQNIGSMDGIPGKNIHFEVIYDLDNKTYNYFYTPEGGVRTEAAQGEKALLTDVGYDVNFQKLAINVACGNKAGAQPVVIELDNLAIRNLPEEVVVTPVAPVVTATSPVDAATGVAINSDITVTFDKAIKEDTIAGVKLFDGATEITAVARTLSADGKTVTINPTADLANSKTYTIKVTTAVTATDNGVLAAEVTKTFTTVAAAVVDPIVAPTVTSIVPANNATNVAIDSDIVITFSKAMNVASLDNIVIKAGAITVPYSKVMSAGDKVVTITPNADLANNTVYTVSIPATVKSADNGVFAGTTYTFTTVAAAVVEPVAAPTVASIVPASGATNVAIDSKIVITFSKAMDVASLGNIVVKAGSTSVAYTKAMSDGDKVITITPSALANNTVYTVTIPATVKSADTGVFAGASYTFTTVAAPIVDPTPSTGTVLWSQDFTGITSDTVPANWAATIGDAASGSYTVTTYSTSVNPATLTWADAATTTRNKIQFIDGKLVLTKQKDQGHGGTQATVTIPTTMTTQPTTGYVVFEFDYNAPAMPVKNAWNVQAGDVQVTNTAGKNVVRFSVNSTNGVQDLLGLSVTSGNYATTVAGPERDNIMSAVGLQGKTLHVQYVFDVANKKYMVFVTPEGAVKESRGSEWIALPDEVTAVSFKNLIVQAQEAYVGGSNPSVTTFDNFKFTSYDLLPAFVSSSIANGAEGVATDGSIVLTFSEAIDPATLAGITFKQGDVAIKVDPIVDGSTVTVPYDTLAGFTEYTLTIPTSVTGVSGLPIQAGTEITFTTGLRVAPTPVVKAITPANLATEVAVNSSIVIDFSVAMNVSSLNNITVKDAKGAVSYTKAISNNNKTVTLTPVSGFAGETAYTVTIPATVISAEGAAFVNTAYTFTTAAAPTEPQPPVTEGEELLWGEDFDDATVGADWTLDMWVRDTHYTNWADKDTQLNKVTFENGKLVFTKQQNYTGDKDYIRVKIPFNLESQPKTGIVAFEYDFMTPGYGEKWTADLWVKDADGADLSNISFGGSYTGIQDLYNWTGSASHSSVIANIAALSDVAGQEVTVRILYDLDNMKYSVMLLMKDGKVLYRPGGWLDMPDAIKKKGAIKFDHVLLNTNCSKREAPEVKTTYDNFRLVKYDATVVNGGTILNGESSVALNTPIILTFNNALNVSTTGGITFYVDDVLVTAKVTASADGKTLTIAPETAFAYSTSYKIVISNTVKDARNMYLSPQTVSFDTVAKPVAFEKTAVEFKDAAGNTITELGAESVVNAASAFVNKTTKAQTITNIIVAYDANGKKLKSDFVTTTIAANSSKSITLGLDVTGLGAATIKVFAIDSFANLTPMIDTEVLQ